MRTRVPLPINFHPVNNLGAVPSNWDSLSWRHLLLSRAKLKASSRVSALLAGFAMIAIMELQITEGPDKPPQALLIAFASTACLLVAVHMAAVMISTCIQPHLDSNIGLNGYTTLEDSPHHRLRLFIEAAWMFSTIVGVVLFLALIVLACWVKFWDLSPPAAVASVAVIVPVLLIFVGFTILFYYTLAGHKVDQANILVENLSMRMRLLESGEMDPNVSALSTSDKKEAADGSP